MKILFIWFLTFVLIFSAFSGGVKEAPKEAPELKQTIYMITHSMPGDVFWGTVYKGMNDAATALGVKAIYLGSKVSGDVAEMIANLETAIEAKPDGIAISVTNPKALEPLLRRAIDQGIPVVAINVADFRPEGERIPYLRYIGEDSYLTGVEQAKAVLKVFQEKYGRPPKAVVFGTHEPGNVVQVKRAEGVIDTVKKAGTKVAEVINIEYDPSRTTEIMRAYLEIHPDVEYIATGSSIVAHWMVGLLEDLNRLGMTTKPVKEGNTFIGGIDVSEQIIQDIIDGKVVATLDQQQYLQGLYGIQLLYLWNKNRYMQGNDIATGPFVIDRSNAQGIRDLIKAGKR